MRTVIAIVSSVLVAFVATVSLLFEVDKDTKILRDDAVVTFAGAKVQKGEATAVTIDHDLDKNLALVVRLGTTK